MVYCCKDSSFQGFGDSDFWNFIKISGDCRIFKQNFSFLTFNSSLNARSFLFCWSLEYFLWLKTFFGCWNLLHCKGNSSMCGISLVFDLSYLQNRVNLLKSRKWQIFMISSTRIHHKWQYLTNFLVRSGSWKVSPSRYF